MRNRTLARFVDLGMDFPSPIFPKKMVRAMRCKWVGVA